MENGQENNTIRIIYLHMFSESYSWLEEFSAVNWRIMIQLKLIFP